MPDKRDYDDLYECIGGPLHGQHHPTNAPNTLNIHTDDPTTCHHYVLVERGAIRIGPTLYYNGTSTITDPDATQ